MAAAPLARPAVFLDRDGVLNHSEVHDGKAYAPRRLEEFVIMPGVPDALTALKAAGYLLIVVTNQPDVGNGFVQRGTVELMNRRLAETLTVDAIEVCFHRQADGCSCRKPKPGMLLAAAGRLGIDLKASFMVGDRGSDVEAGAAAGCRTLFIDRHYAEGIQVIPDLTVDSMAAAAAAILGWPPVEHPG
ncbi:MAG: HAD family hydrolase [Rhodospirillaceae bacterium]